MNSFTQGKYNILINAALLWSPYRITRAYGDIYYYKNLIAGKMENGDYHIQGINKYNEYWHYTATNHKGILNMMRRMA